jgi:hypothetical protein
MNPKTALQGVAIGLPQLAQARRWLPGHQKSLARFKGAEPHGLSRIFFISLGEFWGCHWVRTQCFQGFLQFRCGLTQTKTPFLLLRSTRSARTANANQQEVLPMHHEHTEDHGRIDWAAIARDYFAAAKSIRAIARDRGGVTEAAIRKHAKRHKWIRPDPSSPQPLESLFRALSAQLASRDGVTERSRCFVAAMVALRAPRADIAAALAISERALVAEFADLLTA